MGRVFFHVDLDAFFASVEQLDHPEYRGKPVIVGARPGGRGVVSTCSYEARAFGVHSAMPIGEAARRCPGAVFLPVRMYRYAELSQEVMGIFGSFTPDLRPVSIDEAFLDMTGTEGLWGPPAQAALALSDKVRAETGLSISIGVAANPYVAKIASGLRKPRGLVIVAEGEEEAFMAGLPLAKLWGAGAKTQDRFSELGIRTVSQLAGMTEAGLASLFGKGGGRFLFLASRGRDPGILGGAAESRSLSSERTFERDVGDRGCLETSLLELSELISYRLWKEGLRSRCLVLKLRLSDFSTSSKRITRPRPFPSSSEVYSEALGLLSALWDGRSDVRLIGLGFGDLEAADTPTQAELFDEGSAKRRRAERAIFEIEEKGLGELTRARCLDPKPPSPRE
jgi:DNA polymerase-4